VIARAHIPQQDSTMLKLKNKATITAPGLDPVEGKITVVSPALDPNSTTVEVWVQATNPKQALRPGSSVQVSMLIRTVPNALVIPAVSVVTGEGGATNVMVVGSDGKAHQKAVKVGIKQDDDIQILEGLQAGDKVVSEGAYGLPDNTKIEIQEAGKGDEDKSDAKPGAGKAEDADDKK